MKRPEYPAELETWWLIEATRRLGARSEDAVIAKLETEVAKLSDGFTTDRADGFGDYGADEKALLAYGLFFFPQTYVRTLFQFDEILNRCGWKPAGAKIRIADLGAGTGSAALALASRLPDTEEIEINAIEESETSLRLAEKIARDKSKFWPRLKFHPICEDMLKFGEAGSRFQKEKFDVIIASFSFNECFGDKPREEFDAWIDRALGHLADGGLFLISEPALKSSADRLERLRNRIAADQRFNILAPCLHHSACPMLARGDATFCHEVRWWKFPRGLQRLNRKLFRTIQFLKYSFLAVTKETPTRHVSHETAESARLVSPLMDLKGRMQCEGCAADGAIHRYEILTRNFSSAGKRAFFQTERGDIVEWKNCAMLGDKQTRRTEGAERVFDFDGG